MDSQNPIEKYNHLRSTSKFLFIVYYRGHWCPFCMAYLTQLHTIESSISSAGGSVLVVTSESEENLDATRKSTGLQAKILVDTGNELAGYLKEQGLLDVAISEKSDYVSGMAQPAVLVIDGENSRGVENGKDGEVLERWAILPSLMNLGGAKDRPDLAQIWDNVQAKLKGQEPVHTKYALLGPLTLLKSKIFG